MPMCATLCQALQMHRPTGYVHLLRSTLPPPTTTLLRATWTVLAIARVLPQTWYHAPSHPHGETSGQQDDEGNSHCL